MIPFLEELGRSTAFSFWLPLALWTLIALVVVFVLNVRKSLHPNVRYNALLALLIALPLGFVMANFVETPFSLNTQTALSPTYIEPEWVQAPPSAPRQISETEAAKPLEAIPQSVAPLQPAIHWGWTLLGLSVCMALGMMLWQLGRLLWDLWALRQFRKVLLPLDVTSQAALFQEAMSEVGLKKRDISWMQYTDEVVPMTFGWLKPVVVLPAHLLSDANVLKMVLVHELTHIRRYDFLVHLVARWVQVVFAVHPLAYFLVRQLDEARELVCDADVLRRTKLPMHDYATTLYQLMQRHTSAVPTTTIGMAQHPAFIRKRLEVIGKFVAKPPKSVHLWTLMFFAMTMIAMTFLPNSEKSSSTINVAQKKAQISSVDTTEIRLVRPRVYVNGKLKDKSNTGSHLSELNMKGFGFLIPLTEDGKHYLDQGLYQFSLIPFPNAIEAGEIKGRNLSFTLGTERIEIRCAQPIANAQNRKIYAYFDPSFDTKLRLRWFSDRAEYHYAQVKQLISLGFVHQFEDLFRDGQAKPALSLDMPVFEMNGKRYKGFKISRHHDYKDDDMIFVSAPKFVLKMSFTPFENATQVSVHGNEVAFPTPLGNVKLTSNEPLLRTAEGAIWFEYVPKKRVVEKEDDSFTLLRGNRNSIQFAQN